MRSIVRIAALAILALGVAFAGAARAETKIRFGLDWIPGSVHSPFFIALYKGYYKAEGLDVMIDPGKGSVGLVQQIGNRRLRHGLPRLRRADRLRFQKSEQRLSDADGGL